jgi:hypothetical protein
LVELGATEKQLAEVVEPAEVVEERLVELGATEKRLAEVVEPAEVAV